MRLSARLNGILLFILGAIATIAPLFSSVWGVPIVGAAIFLSGIVELADAWFSDNTRTHYSSGVFSVLAGALISIQSAFAFSGLMVLMSLVLALDGGVNVVRAVRGTSEASRLRRGLSGQAACGTSSTASANILLALLVWALRDSIGAARVWRAARPAHGGVGLANDVCADRRATPMPSRESRIVIPIASWACRRIRSSGSSIAKPWPTPARARRPISIGA